MNGLPHVLKGNDFPQTNFKKLGANENNRLYRLLNLVKDMFYWFFKQHRKTKPKSTLRRFRKEYEKWQKICGDVALN